MKYNKSLLLGLAIFAFVSCSTNDDGEPLEAPGSYSDGILVLNEGNYLAGNSSVTFISKDFAEVNQNIFTTANSGSMLGDTATDMGFYEDYAFIVVNVSNKVVVVDRNTWKKVITIEEELENPRKIAFSGGKAYVTNWGDGMDPADDFIAVFEIPGFTLVETIPVDEGPDDILAANNKIYVAHSGGFSFGNSISVINVQTNKVEKTISVGEVPNALALQGNDLWVLSAGLPYYALEGETAGSISKIDLLTATVVEEFNFSEANEHPANLVNFLGRLFYTLGNNVYEFTAEEGVAKMPFLEPQEADVLYGFQLWNNKILIASANNDFSGNGKLLVYDFSTQVLLENMSTGVNPNGIFINQ